MDIAIAALRRIQQTAAHRVSRPIIGRIGPALNVGQFRGSWSTGVRRPIGNLSEVWSQRFLSLWILSLRIDRKCLAASRDDNREVEYGIPRLHSPLNSRRFPEISVIQKQASCRYSWKTVFSRLLL